MEHQQRSERCPRSCEVADKCLQRALQTDKFVKMSRGVAPAEDVETLEDVYLSGLMSGNMPTMHSPSPAKGHVRLHNQKHHVSVRFASRSPAPSHHHHHKVLHNSHLPHSSAHDHADDSGADGESSSNDEEGMRHGASAWSAPVSEAAAAAAIATLCTGTRTTRTAGTGPTAKDVAGPIDCSLAEVKSSLAELRAATEACKSYSRPPPPSVARRRGSLLQLHSPSIVSPTGAHITDAELLQQRAEEEQQGLLQRRQVLQQYRQQQAALQQQVPHVVRAKGRRGSDGCVRAGTPSAGPAPTSPSSVVPLVDGTEDAAPSVVSQPPAAPASSRRLSLPMYLLQHKSEGGSARSSASGDIMQQRLMANESNDGSRSSAGSNASSRAWRASTLPPLLGNAAAPPPLLVATGSNSGAAGSPFLTAGSLAPPSPLAYLMPHEPGFGSLPCSPAASVHGGGRFRRASVDSPMLDGPHGHNGNGSMHGSMFASRLSMLSNFSSINAGDCDNEDDGGDWGGADGEDVDVEQEFLDTMLGTFDLASQGSIGLSLMGSAPVISPDKLLEAQPSPASKAPSTKLGACSLPKVRLLRAPTSSSSSSVLASPAAAGAAADALAADAGGVMSGSSSMLLTSILSTGGYPGGGALSTHNSFDTGAYLGSALSTNNTVRTAAPGGQGAVTSESSTSLAAGSSVLSPKPPGCALSSLHPRSHRLLTDLAEGEFDMKPRQKIRAPEKLEQQMASRSAVAAAAALAAAAAAGDAPSAGAVAAKGCSTPRGAGPGGPHPPLTPHAPLSPSPAHVHAHSHSSHSPSHFPELHRPSLRSAYLKATAAHRPVGDS